MLARALGATIVDNRLRVEPEVPVTCERGGKPSPIRQPAEATAITRGCQKPTI